MFKRKLAGFSLEGVFAVNLDKGAMRSPFVGIGGFGFEGLDFDLLGFLRLKAEHLALRRRTWVSPAGERAEGAALSFTGLNLSILDYPVLRNGAGAFFSLKEDKGEGFWVMLSDPVESSIFKLEWAFIAQNVDFSTDIAKDMLLPPPEKEPGTNPNYDAIQKALYKAWERDDAVSIYPARGAGGRGWTFAAAMTALNGGLAGRALIQDGGFTGLALYGDLLRQLLNWNFVFVGLYRNNISPGEDYFYFSVTLPPFTYGGARFSGGAIAAEFYTSGDFMVDLGFPWPAPGGGRRWERTFGAIVTPGQASGGFYIRKRSQALATGGRALTVAGGFALQWGLGAAFGGGVFEVWVRIGVYIIVEGEVTLRMAGGSFTIIAFTLHGAAGVLVEGQGRIDWWVIRVTIAVRASAEIRASLYWREGEKMVMPIEAELYVSASAEACIGGSCARICRSISVGLSLPVRYQLTFG
jgi:hypothetical protein